jgi:hypothetical protein
MFLLAGLMISTFPPSDRSRRRPRLWCERCNREWVSSIYLDDGPHSCPLCHRPLSERPDVQRSAEDALASLWDVRLHSHDQIGRQPPRSAEVRVVFETLELLLDGIIGSDLHGQEELDKRVAWADFVLRRAFSALADHGAPAQPELGPEETLRRGARVWAAIDQSGSGREAALAIAGLTPDDLRAALLAAVLERVETQGPAEAAKWRKALASFTEWWRPQDLL